MSGPLMALCAIGTQEIEYKKHHPNSQKGFQELTSMQLIGDTNTKQDNTVKNIKTLTIPLGTADNIVPLSFHVANPVGFEISQIKFFLGSSKPIFKFTKMFYDANPDLYVESEEEDDGEPVWIKFRLPKTHGLDKVFYQSKLTKSPIRVEVSYYGICDTIKMFVKNHVFDRRKSPEIIESEIIQVQEQEIMHNELKPNMRKIGVRLNFEYLTNGYYLMGFQKSDLEHLKILINNTAIVDWDELHIDEFVESKDNGIYIPLNDTQDNFSNALNQSRIDHLDIQFVLKPDVMISYDDESKTYGVMCYVWNYIRIIDGVLYVNNEKQPKKTK